MSIIKIKASKGKINKANQFTMVHELRNPLTNVILSCDYLLEEIKNKNPDKETLSKSLEIIARNCSRMNQLIVDFVQKGQESKSLDNSINGILEESLFLASDRINLKKVAIEKSFCIDKSVPLSQHDNFRIAFLNIIINAVESMETGKGILQITSSEDKLSYSVKIADNGSGIRECDKTKLFQPFFTRKIGGLGIGLVITRNLLLEVNASLHVKSKLGHGSEFTIRFKKKNTIY